MPRNMSFMLTTQQIRNRTKTVTRRLGWWFLKPGDLLWACEKCQGLKKGEKMKRIALIQTVSSAPERLGGITQEECNKEGFPHLTPDEFVAMFIAANPTHRVWVEPLDWQGRPVDTCTHRTSKAGEWVTVKTTPDSLVNRIEFQYVEECDDSPTGIRVIT